MIRDYNKNDLDAIMSIWYESQSIAHPFLTDEFVDKVKKMMLEKFIPNSKTMVHEQEGIVNGFIAMMNNEIGGLFVCPKSQSKGIGSKLIDHVSKYHKTLEVEVFKENKIGMPFYIKQGFNIISDYDDESTNQKVIRMKRINL